jgi:hypothetical protein
VARRSLSSLHRLKQPLSSSLGIEWSAGSRALDEVCCEAIVVAGVIGSVGEATGDHVSRLIEVGCLDEPEP